jgi:hypothetical protein
MLVNVLRALALLLALALVGPGCTCTQLMVESTFDLRPDEVGLSCKEVCLEAVDDGYAFESCELSAAQVHPPQVTCRYSRESCSVQASHF